MYQSKPRRRLKMLFCVALAGLFVAPQTQAIRFDWTADEIACANSQRIPLGGETDPSNPRFVEHMSWIADRIVTGVVGEVKHDIQGSYPTLATVTVAASLKGGIPPSTEITVASMSGPSFSDYHGVMATLHVGGDNPSFTSGENVLLFLSTGYDVLDEKNPSKYALPTDHYRLVDGHKFTLHGDSFVLDRYPANTYSISNLSTRIAAIVATQASQCAELRSQAGSRPPTPGDGSSDGGEFEPEPCHPSELNPCDGGGSAGGGMGGAGMTAEMCPDRNSQKLAWNATSSDPEDLEYRPSCPGCGNGLGLAMRRVLRNMMKLTSNGRRYLSFWSTHRMEVIAIFDAHPDVGALAGSRVNDFMPGLRTWLYKDVNGSNFTLDAARIAQIEEVVNAIKRYGSATLQADLDTCMVAIRLEQGKTVKAGLAHLLGLTL